MRTHNNAFIGLICFLIATVSFSESERPVSQITIHVRADDGIMVTGIVVGVGTFWKHVPGEGFGRDEHKTVTGKTDANGFVTLSIPSLTGDVGFSPHLPLSGFYWDRGDRIKFTNAVAGKWQPWNPTVELQLKRIGNPIPMYAKKYGERKTVKIPEIGKAIGFDLMQSDWVAPYGSGETADFIFKLDSRVTGDKDFDATLSVAFSNVGDGIQSVYALPFKGSQLRLSRKAPADGYEDNLVRRTHCSPGEQIYRENREDQNYVFRVRTKKDDKGNIVSALYGKIHGEIGWWQNSVIRFTYYLNPTPNDRNLEFDPNKNLFKNLSPLEKVSEP